MTEELVGEFSETEGSPEVVAGEAAVVVVAWEFSLVEGWYCGLTPIVKMRLFTIHNTNNVCVYNVTYIWLA